MLLNMEPAIINNPEEHMRRIYIEHPFLKEDEGHHKQDQQHKRRNKRCSFHRGIHYRHITFVTHHVNIKTYRAMMISSCIEINSHKTFVYSTFAINL